MTVEKMIAGQRSPRNPFIVEVLRDYGYVDAPGMGGKDKDHPFDEATQQSRARFRGYGRLPQNDVAARGKLMTISSDRFLTVSVCSDFLTS
jgi:hypothetical protein